MMIFYLNQVHSLVHENAMLREQQQQFYSERGQMSNGIEGHKGRSSVHSRSSRGSGGTRPQSMFEPRDQERLSQKLNKVRNTVGLQWLEH